MGGGLFPGPRLDLARHRLAHLLQDVADEPDRARYHPDFLL
jgi:hypothetical protein